jgi:integrase/recombinase XerD
MAAHRKSSHDWFERYLAHLERLGRKSMATNRSYVRVYSSWLAANSLGDVCQLARKDLEAFLYWLATEHRPWGRKLAANTIMHYQVFLRGFHGFLKHEGEVLSNPMDGIPTTKVPRRIRKDALTIGELAALLAAPDADTLSGLRDLVALRLMAFSGLRVGALCRLGPDQIRVPEREIMIRQGKGGKDRLTFFDPDTRKVIARYLARARALLAGPQTRTLLADDKGRQMRGWQVKDMVARYTRRAGIDKHITPHSLRRTFCTLLLQAGCNLKAVAELAGHNSLDTTAGYTRLNPEELVRIYRQAHPRGSL